MPRSRLIRIRNFPYHVCARANNKEWFHLPLEQMHELFINLLLNLLKRHQIQIHAFVTMSNHFHLALSTPNANLDEVMLYFLREAARRANQASGRINHLFGGPYKWSLIENRRNYAHVIKYIYRNPVQAGICQNVQDYPFSTLPAVHGLVPTRIPISDSIFDRRSTLDLSPGERLNWLNEPYELDEHRLIQLGLRRARFAIRTSNVPQRIIERLSNSTFGGG